MPVPGTSSTKRGSAPGCLEIKSAKLTGGARRCFYSFSSWVVSCDSQDLHHCTAGTLVDDALGN
jgi:hypothetical protein